MSQTLGEFQYRLSKTPIGAGVDAELLLGLINDRLEQITRSRPWTRLEKQATLQTVAEYTTGTVTIDVGDTDGTGTDTVFTEAMDGRLIRLGNLIQFYTFIFVTATTFEISRPYEGTTDLEDSAFTIWQPVYELPADLAEISSLRNPTWGFDLEEASREWLDRSAATRFEIGPPRRWVPAEDSATGRTQIELHPGPDEAIGLPMRYTAKAPYFSAGETSDQFPDWISVPCVYAGVLADLYRLQDEQQRAQSEEKRFEALLSDMAGEDARKTPVAEMNMADRYTQHRQARTLRSRGRAALRNWSGTE